MSEFFGPAKRVSIMVAPRQRADSLVTFPFRPDRPDEKGFAKRQAECFVDLLSAPLNSRRFSKSVQNAPDLLTSTRLTFAQTLRETGPYGDAYYRELLPQKPGGHSAFNVMGVKPV